MAFGFDWVIKLVWGSLCGKNEVFVVARVLVVVALVCCAMRACG